MRTRWIAAGLALAACGDDGGPAAPDGAVAIDAAIVEPDATVSTGDCTMDVTVPGPMWEPVDVLEIPVVVHVIADADCVTGNVSDAMVESQIEILNEDFLASGIQFSLEAITRDCNATWYQDDGDYWTTLAVDPAGTLNLYTNTAANARGYVPFLPAEPDAEVGLATDRVVINWLAFGRDGPFPPHDQGRTATHEIGHFLGLFHPYYEGCGIETAPGCYTTGDRICDTAPDEASHDGCPVGATSCGGVPVPVANFMELTDDACMTGFTAEQTQRMRCTLATYRPLLATDAALTRSAGTAIAPMK